MAYKMPNPEGAKCSRESAFYMPYSPSTFLYAIQPEYLLICHTARVPSYMPYSLSTFLYAIQPEYLLMSLAIIASVCGLWASVVDFQEYNEAI